MWNCESFSYRRLIKKNFYQGLEKTNIAEVANTSIELTVMIDFKMCCLYVVFSFIR